LYRDYPSGRKKMRTSWTRWPTIAAVMTIIPLVGGPLAEGQPVESPTECAGMETLRASIDELTAVLREQISGQERREQLQLAIAYLQFRSRRIESLEGELRRLEERRSSHEQQVGRLTGEVEAAERRLQDLTTEQAEGWERQVDRMQRAIEAETGAIDRLDVRIIDLENEILDGRRQLIALEDFVLENLDFGD
jgi:chromosome segregation ATPase